MSVSGELVNGLSIKSFIGEPLGVGQMGLINGQEFLQDGRMIEFDGVSEKEKKELKPGTRGYFAGAPHDRISGKNRLGGTRGISSRGLERATIDFHRSPVQCLSDPRPDLRYENTNIKWEDAQAGSWKRLRNTISGSGVHTSHHEATGRRRKSSYTKINIGSEDVAKQKGSPRLHTRLVRHRESQAFHGVNLDLNVILAGAGQPSPSKKRAARFKANPHPHRTKGQHGEENRVGAPEATSEC
ncbi:hypothetical protein KM043_016401 [Ampulex compressa]|nr:hypothetical protein KM043_016401 [Ampulex compressa]